MEALKEKASRLTYSFAPFQLDPMEHRLVRDGHLLRLPPKVFETLVLLVERHGLLVEKDDLMKALWPDTFVEEVTLARNISLLRKALGDPPGQDESLYIETVSKHGYRFIAEVTEVSQPDASSSGPQDAGSGSVGLGTPKRWWQAPSVWIASTAVVPLLAGIGSFWWYRVLHHPQVEIHSLAVLPLENLSGDPEQEYFADGMTDELITKLAQIHSLRVISRTSVMQFKHTKKNLREIAGILNVDAVVEGSVSRADNNVRITAQLLDAHQDRHLWAATYERQMEDVLELQTHVARSIADQVKVSLTPEENTHLSRQRPRNPEAYDALLKGRFIRNGRMANTAQALPYFQQAVAIDPSNAEAWEALADSYAALGADLGGNPAVMRPMATAALAKALELEPDLAEAHVTSGWMKMWYEWDWDGAEREFKRGVDLSPNNSEIHRRYSHYLQVRGRFDEALEENRRAINLAPLDILPQAHLAWLYVDARMPDQAIEQSKRAIEMDPTLSGPYLWLTMAYEMKHQWSEAFATWEHFKDTSQPDYMRGLADIAAKSGDMPRADAIMNDLRKYAQHNYVSPLAFASYEAQFGDHERAFQLLEKAYREHATGLIDLETSAAWDHLRSDPRFRDLEKRVGFQSSNVADGSLSFDQLSLGSLNRRSRMNWEGYFDVAQWPYLLQETFKGATVLLVLLVCLRLWRRWSGNPLRASFGSILCVLCLALVTAMEFAAAMFLLWPYLFGWPHNPMLLARIYEATMPLSVVAICAGTAGLVGKDRGRWVVLCLAVILWCQWIMFRSGELASIVSLNIAS